MLFRTAATGQPPQRNSCLLKVPCAPGRASFRTLQIAGHLQRYSHVAGNGAAGVANSTRMSAASTSSGDTHDIDSLWAAVSGTVASNDCAGMAALYHPDAVLVSSDSTMAVSEKMTVWNEGMEKIRAEGRSASVSFRFSSRQHDVSTAFDCGIFRYAETDAAGVEQPVFVKLEALMVKKDGQWLMMMERQLEATDEAAWELLEGAKK